MFNDDLEKLEKQLRKEERIATYTFIFVMCIVLFALINAVINDNEFAEKLKEYDECVEVNYETYCKIEE